MRKNSIKKSKSLAINIIYQVLRMTGIFYLLQIAYRHKVTILMLHGVVDGNYKGEWQPLWPRMTKEHFREKILFLKKYYNIISMEQAVEILNGRAKPVNNSLVLTFDDGYKNFYTDVVPVLKEFEIPAIVYVVTNYINSNKRFWIDRLDYILQMQKNKSLTISVGDKKFEFKNNRKLSKKYREFRLYIKDVYRDDAAMNQFLNETLENLEQETGLKVASIENDLWSELMDWDEIRVLHDFNVEVGSHTENHLRIPLINAELAELELKKSKEEIEAQIKKECVHFCYPNGDSDKKAAKIVEKTGYKAAVSTRYGLNSIGDNLFLLKRIPMPCNISNEKLLLNLYGIKGRH